MRIAIGGPNHFPATLLLIIPFLFLSTIFNTSNLKRFVLLGSTGIILWTFFIGMSRGAVLGLMVIVMVILIKYRKYAPRMMLLLPVAIILGIYYMPEEFWVRMVRGFTLEDRGSGRLDIWLVGWNMINDNLLLGVGLSNFPVAFDSYRSITANLVGVVKSSRAPHNTYLGTVAELGIVGGALLLVLIVGHLRKGYKAFRFFEGKSDRSGEIVAFSTILSLLGLLTISVKGDLLLTKLLWISLALVQATSLMTLKVTGKENNGIASHQL